MVTVSVKPLSSLAPTNFAYKYNSTDEKLASTTKKFSNGFSYTTHEAFANLKDFAISNKNVVFLTDVKDIKTVFEKPIENTSLVNNLCNFYLKPKNNENKIKLYENVLYVGGSKGEDLLLTTRATATGLSELRLDDKRRVVVSSHYPYTLEVTDKELENPEIHREQFEIELFHNSLTIKTKTADGLRYISYGSDLQLKANGLMLNNLTVNSYLFEPEFVTISQINRGFDPTIKRVRYYNEDGSRQNVTTLDVQEQHQQNTNLLITSAVKDVSKSNIAILKTNQL